MKRRVLVVAAAIIILVILGAATFAAPQGFIPQHRIINAQSVLHAEGLSNQVATASAPLKSSGRYPAQVIISGKVTPQMRKAHPNVTGSTWSCALNTFAYKLSATGIGVSGYVDCNWVMSYIQQTVFADRCNPVLWGCLWTTNIQLGQCYDNIISLQWCPGQGQFNYYSVTPGYLWRGRVTACVDANDGTGQHCGTTSQEIQY